MKGLVLKDIYNLKSNMRSMLIMWLIMCFLVKTTSVETYLVMVATMIGLMSVVSTFSYDDHCHWNRYAVIMPVEKRDIVRAKYITLLCFTLFGVLFGTFAAQLGGVLTGSFTFSSEAIRTLLPMWPATFSITLLIGGTAILFVYKFGVEKARLIMVFAGCLPVLVIVAVYWFADAVFGVEFTESLVITLMCLSPLFALAYAWITYRISVRIFETQEF